MDLADDQIMDLAIDLSVPLDTGWWNEADHPIADHERERWSGVGEGTPGRDRRSARIGIGPAHRVHSVTMAITDEKAALATLPGMSTRGGCIHRGRRP